MWSVRELNRYISSQYFERRLAAQLSANAEDLQIANTIARYSVLNDSDQLFEAKYMTYMPSERGITPRD